MSPLPGSVRATAPSLHEYRQPLPAATRPAVLAWLVAGSGHSRGGAGYLLVGPVGASMAATATGRHVNAAVVAVALVMLAAAWVIRLWLWPFAPCRRCRGDKTNPGSNKRRFGKCPRCNGTGHRIRFGARTVHRAILRRRDL